MKNIFKLSIFLFAGLLAAVVTSCKKEFTEQDALNAQQQIDLALYIFNQTDPAQAPIANAKVTVTQNGITSTVNSDAGGAALFPKIRIGNYVYRIEADNFITSTGVGSATTTNFRQGQVTGQIGMISNLDADLATVKGTVTVEKDLTNVAREFASTIDIYFDVTSSGQPLRTFTTKTDANGAYSIKLPVNGSATTTVNLRFPDFESDQVIAVNQYADETGSFTAAPQVLPRKETAKAIFSMDQTVTQYQALPAVGGVRSLFAVVEASPNGAANQAIISNVVVNGAGVITDVGFFSGGNHTGDADGKINVTFTSLDGGSGASLQITLGSNSSVANAYAGLNGGSKSLIGGTGYPTSNFTLNRTTTRTPSFRTSIVLIKGTVAIANADYGTGTYRSRNPQ